MKKKILIIGYGYVGGYLYERLTRNKNCDVTIVKREFLDYTNATAVEGYLRREKDHFNYVINCSGFTGRPNVDEGEKKPELCYELNTFTPLRISNLCKTYNIGYIHISSGCIYTGYDQPFSEDDKPNFGLFNPESSTYSKSKHAFELGSDYGLILRVRMPFCDKLHDRSYLTKILKYNNLINNVNSKTYIPQLLDFIEHVLDKEYNTRKKDIVNFVHPNALATDAITELMKACDLKNPKWEWVTFDDLNCAANRSNCVMSVEKLQTEYKFNIWDEKVAIQSALNNIITDE
tara:strand:+ start:34 stop:903 length:870 start_codon:yes stop_codon:yes gene_type:complete